jgi:adenylosuccinate synthase
LEHAKGDQKIGSTLRGIGPTYSDKTGRQGIRVGDLLQEGFNEKYEGLKAKHIQVFKFHQFDFSQLEELEKEFFNAVEYIKSLNIANTEYLINEHHASGKTVLAEGAQGTLLDVDFGSYPFVTSSNTCAAGVSVGLGMAPSTVKKTIGIFKAYCTRVGSGPFPTELFDEDGEILRKNGHEFGATTGRPRRCGWIDLVALKYAVMLNGVTDLYMMKADVLSGFETIKAAVAYKLPDGTETTELPYDLTQTEVEPIYKEFEGWNQDLTSVRKFEDLPDTLKSYNAFLEEYLGVQVKCISVGPDREETIMI